MSEVAQYQSYVRERRNRLLAFLAVTFAIAAVASLALWLLPDTELDTSSLELRAPTSYEEIFEVFMQARVRMNEEAGLEDSAYIDDEVLEEDSEYGFFDEDILEEEDFADEAQLSEDLTEEDFIFDESTLLEGFDDDPDAFAEYQALLDDLALLEADDIDERDPLNEGGAHMPEEEFLEEEEEQSGEDAEYVASNEDEYRLDEEEDYLLYDDEEYLDEEVLYFDEEEMFADSYRVSMGFSPLALMHLEEEGAQNPQYFYTYASVENEYLFVQSPDVIYIFELNNGDIIEPVAYIQPGEYPVSASGSEDAAVKGRFAALFLTDSRLVAISTSGQEVFDYTNLFTTVQIFDLTLPASPELVSSYSITGAYSGSRIKNSVLTVATDHAVLDLSRVTLEVLETFIPYVSGPEGTVLTPVEDIRIVGDFEHRETSYTQLVSIDLTDETRLDAQLALLGGSEIVYAGTNTIYLINNAELQQGRKLQMASSITQVCMQESTLSFEESLVLPGVIEGLCSINESDSGTLRVVAPAFSYLGSYSEILEIDDFIGTGQNFTTKMQIFVLDEHLEIAASLNDFDTDEILYPQHFVGDTLFLNAASAAEYENRSYRIDLSDPTNLQIVTEPEFTDLPKILIPWVALSERDTALGVASEPTSWIGLGIIDGARNGDDGHLEGYEGDSSMMVRDSGLILEMRTFSAGTFSSSHRSFVEGYLFSDAFTYPESLFAQAMQEEAGIIAFPADENFVAYSFGSDSGFTRQLELYLGDNFHPRFLARSGVAGEFFVLLQQTDSLEIWLYRKADFSEAGHLKLSELSKPPDLSE